MSVFRIMKDPWKCTNCASITSLKQENIPTKYALYSQYFRNKCRSTKSFIKDIMIAPKKSSISNYKMALKMTTI